MCSGVGDARGRGCLQLGLGGLPGLVFLSWPGCDLQGRTLVDGEDAPAAPATKASPDIKKPAFDSYYHQHPYLQLQSSAPY